MTGRIIRGIVGAVVLAAGLWVGARGAGPLPPLGLLLGPVNGAWAAATHANLPRQARATIPGLAGPVDVRYDDRGVPHIFATNELDAYRALGYVVARDRLFQMDLQTRAATGRLTEWVGARALSVDRQTRDLGMPWGAERKLAAMDTAGMGYRVMTAFAAGVNAYVGGLTPQQWPVEYKLLGVRPDHWKPINSIDLFLQMSRTLTYLPDEALRIEARAAVGDSAADALFPINSPIQEPIQPDGKNAPTFNLHPLPPPGRPDTTMRAVASILRDFAPHGFGEDPEQGHFASNNWAVAPSRSADHHALLANDPHLTLTLPSIWYEAQLVVPGSLDVYGVTIPGAPGIVLGFNRNLAWGFTNTGADVLDFYRETVDDSQHPTRYRVDGVWKPLQQRVEVYRGKHGQVLATDTLRFTHRGPLMHRFGEWVSMRWTALEPSHEIDAFYQAAHDSTTQSFLDDMARGFFVPAQNILVADRSGSIAIRSTGHFPLRPKGTNGLEIFDGSTSASDWRGFWPVDKYPQSFNPAQGYLASANQQPEDPKQEYAYLGDNHAFEVWRALDINRLLRADSDVTVDAMRRFQTDPMSVRAQLFLPYFIAAAQNMAGHEPASAARAATILEHWNAQYTRDNHGAALFEEAMRDLRRFTWDELEDAGGRGRRVVLPGDQIMFDLLHHPDSPWWDDRSTPNVVETRDMIVVKSLAAAYDTLSARYGPPGPDGWQWDHVAKVNINNLLGLTGFSARGLESEGGIGTLNPAPGYGTGGPSWRLVVDLDPAGVKAWDTYPGGQSGNPASPEYENRIPQWLAGKLSPVLFPADSAALPAASTEATLTLVPGGR